VCGAGADTLGGVRLTDLGWTDERARQFDEAAAGKPDLHPGRVAVEFNHIYRVYGDGAEWEAVSSGRLKHRAARRAELPAVGDWVVVRRRPEEDRCAIVAVLPRSSAFSRKVAGELTDEQVVAANIDVVFVLTALDGDFSVRRVERFLLLAREGGASPVVLLTKPDLCADVPGAVAEAVTVAGDVPVHVVSPLTGDGMEHVQRYVGPARTCALLGSSGVGKSTIVNRLVGSDVRRTRSVRAADSKGRHTTTHRELVPIPDGGLLIDTPGMREVQLWDAGGGVEQTFEDVETLGQGCHFTDCRHLDEPRCAVKAAVGSGQLDASRLDSYQRLQGELRHLAARQDVRARLEDKRRAKVANRALSQKIRLKGAKDG
jgi:ribosome biogenesis GTPase / thiamine phosphate phosphatase